MTSPLCTPIRTRSAAAAALEAQAAECVSIARRVAANPKGRPENIRGLMFRAKCLREKARVLRGRE
jgi:hypothetical protein